MARTTDLDTELQSRIETFVAELSELVRRSALDSVRQALGGSENGTAVAVRRGPGRPRGSRTAARGGNGRKAPARSGGRRTSEDLDSTTERILAHVRQNPGQRAEQIGAELGIANKDMRLPMQKLIGGKVVRTQGQRRGTTYFAGRGGSGGGRRKTTARRGAKRGRQGARKAGRRSAGARGPSEGMPSESIAASGR